MTSYTDDKIYDDCNIYNYPQADDNTFKKIESERIKSYTNNTDGLKKLREIVHNTSSNVCDSNAGYLVLVPRDLQTGDDQYYTVNINPRRSTQLGKCGPQEQDIPKLKPVNMSRRNAKLFLIFLLVMVSTVTLSVGISFIFLRSDIEKHQNDLGHAIQNNVSSACGPTAFRAMKTSSQNVTSTAIKFDDVGLNEGNGYNSKTGIFTAPSDGIYVFSWTIVTVERVLTSTELVVNRKMIAKGSADARDSLKWMDDSSTNTVPVSMKRGEEAFIRINNRWGNFVYGKKFSQFSGWKLH